MSEAIVRVPKEKVEATIGDSANLDAFSRLRTSQPFGIFDNKNISSRNRNQWEEPITGVIVVYSGLAVSTFGVGNEVRGLLPTGFISIGTVVSDNGTDAMVLDVGHNDFQIGDTLTDQTSGATCTVVSTNTGSDIQHDYDRSSVILTAGIGATDSAVRHTHRYHAYVPGKGQLIFVTFIMGEAKANVRRRVGYFDTLNGLFVEQTSTDLALVVRSSTSGSVVDTRIVRNSSDGWNIDNLDGTGPSGKTLDLTKSQILIIDFQWLGVGRVRYGFDIDGVVYYVHQVLNANNLDVVYMKTPSLPIRYEIANTGVPASSTILEEICSSVASEGGYTLPGVEFSKSNDITARTVTTTLTPVMAIRLKNNFPAGEPNRKIVQFLSSKFMVATNNAHIELLHAHEPIDIIGTFSDVSAGSGVEVSTDISAFTGRPSHKIVEDFAPTAQAGKANATDISGNVINLHGFISQSTNSDNSQMFVLMAQSFTGNSDVSVANTWREFE